MSAEPGRRSTTLPPDDPGRSAGGGLAFDGTGDYQAFKFGMIQTLRTMTDKSRQERAVYAFRSLRGEALRYLLSSMPAQEDNNDEDMGRFPFTAAAQIWQRLDSHYALAGTVTKQQAISKLVSIKQGKRSVQEYTSEFTQFSSLSGFQDTELIAIYLRGLRADVNAVIGVALPLSWPEAVQNARRGEELANAIRPKIKNQSAPRGRGGHHQVPGRGAQESTAIKCYNCQQEGHMARNCPRGQPSGRGRGRGGRNSQPGRQAQPEPRYEEEDEYELDLPGNE